MLTLYLVCLVFGGIFLLVTLLSGHDVSSDLDVDVNGDVSADIHADGEGIAEALKFLSFRNIVFFLAFFGLSGVCLTLLGTPAGIGFPTAVLVGGFAGFLIHRVMRYLRQTESGAATNLKSIEGLRARVSISLNRQQMGKIVVNNREQYLQVIAKVADEAGKDHFDAGEAVTVVRVNGDLALVAEEDFIR